MIKKLMEKKLRSIRKESHLIKSINRGNLGYSNKPASHTNLIERQNKKILTLLLS